MGSQDDYYWLAQKYTVCMLYFNERRNEMNEWHILVRHIRQTEIEFDNMFDSIQLLYLT